MNGVMPTEVIDSDEYEMTFGQYQGTPLSELIEDNPKYVKWLMANTAFRLSRELQEEVEASIIIDSQPRTYHRSKRTDHGYLDDWGSEFSGARGGSYLDFG